MRLITRHEETTSFELQEFFDQAIPPYAILSHTWGKDEVTYKDFASGRGPLKEGYVKIKATYDLALQSGYNYLWVDTCCIDKSSSAELSEAINAMFEWYARAQVCYAYLNDFDSKDRQVKPLAKALWFSRGWTLQELIAPVDVRFYDKAWRFFGTRTELHGDILAITGIHASVLEPAEPEYRLRAVQDALTQLTVAQRMSWAAKRQTTREEDIAYSLLGIFGVNMPMVYGQGSRAFQRLQEEIMKESNDLTILAWESNSAIHNSHTSYTGILATHPSEFEETGSYQPLFPTKFNPSFVMTNKGLQIDANVQKVGTGGKDGTQEIVMSLECRLGARGDQMAVIALKHLGGGVYVRCRPNAIFAISETNNEMSKRTIFISRTANEGTSLEVAALHRFAIHFDLGTRTDIKLVHTHPQQFWEPERQLFNPPQSLAVIGFHRFQKKRAGSYLVELDFVLAFGTHGGAQRSWWVCYGEKSNSGRLFNAAVRNDWAAVDRLRILGPSYPPNAWLHSGVDVQVHVGEARLGQECITRVTLT